MMSVRALACFSWSLSWSIRSCANRLSAAESFPGDRDAEQDAHRERDEDGRKRGEVIAKVEHLKGPEAVSQRSCSRATAFVGSERTPSAYMRQNGPDTQAGGRGVPPFVLEPDAHVELLPSGRARRASLAGLTRG
jgi:hypothetical protein